jgi:hypothetical protein
VPIALRRVSPYSILLLPPVVVVFTFGCGARLEREGNPSATIVDDSAVDAGGPVVTDSSLVPEIDGDTGRTPFDVDIVSTPEIEVPHDWATGKLCDPTIPSGWRPMTSLATVAIDHGSVKGAVWSGKEMIVVADAKCTAPPCATKQQLLAYDPASDRWRVAAAVELYGREMRGPLIPLGGDDVARIDLERSTYWVSRDLREAYTRSFDRMGTCVTYGGAQGYAAATGELVMWGGGRWEDGPSWVPCAEGIAVQDGVARRMAPAPATLRGGHATAVTIEGSLLIVSWDDMRIARYEAEADRWVDLGALPSIGGRDAPAAMGQLGNHVAFFGGLAFGGNESSFVALDGASFDASSSTWTALPAAPATAKGDRWRDDPASWMQPGKTGAPELVLFSGFGYEHSDFLADTIAVDVTTGAWRTLSAGGGLGPRTHAIAVWTGCEAVIYGGDIDSAVLTDGAIFKP